MYKVWSITRALGNYHFWLATLGLGLVAMNTIGCGSAESRVCVYNQASGASVTVACGSVGTISETLSSNQ